MLWFPKQLSPGNVIQPQRCSSTLAVTLHSGPSVGKLSNAYKRLGLQLSSIFHCRLIHQVFSGFCSSLCKNVRKRSKMSVTVSRSSRWCPQTSWSKRKNFVFKSYTYWSRYLFIFTGSDCTLIIWFHQAISNERLLIAFTDCRATFLKSHSNYHNNLKTYWE